jgi:hypothetical protein
MAEGEGAEFAARVVVHTSVRFIGSLKAGQSSGLTTFVTHRCDRWASPEPIWQWANHVIARSKGGICNGAEQISRCEDAEQIRNRPSVRYDSSSVGAHQPQPDPEHIATPVWHAPIWPQDLNRPLRGYIRRTETVERAYGQRTANAG